MTSIGARTPILLAQATASGDSPRVSRPATSSGDGPRIGINPSAQQLLQGIGIVAPESWSQRDIELVANAALASTRSTDIAMETVQAVHSASPENRSTVHWSGPQEARVAAASLTGNRTPGVAGSVINAVQAASPEGWASESDTRLAVAALQNGVGAERAGRIIGDAVLFSRDEWQAVANAEAQMTAPGGNTSSGDTPARRGTTGQGNPFEIR